MGWVWMGGNVVGQWKRWSERRRRFLHLHPFLSLLSVKVMQLIRRKVVRLLSYSTFHFATFWRCVTSLRVSSSGSTHQHPSAPGQACLTSHLWWPGETEDHPQTHRDKSYSYRDSTWASFLPSLYFFPAVTDNHCRLRQSSSGSLSSGKEQKGKGKAWGRGRVWPF